MRKRLWSKFDKPKFIAGTSLLAGLLILEIVATSLIPEWRKYFYNILENKDSAKFIYGIGYFIALMGALIIAQSFKEYVARTTAIHWRTALTKVLLKKWVKEGDRNRVDNPCQRINEDAKLVSDLAISVAIEVIISASIVIALLASTSNANGIVLASMVYTVIASAGAYMFKNRLVDTEIGMQKAEADHRFTLSKIALYQDDYTAKEKYLNVVERVKVYLRTLLGFSIFSATQGNVSILIPWLILSVPYFKGSMTLGDFMGGVAAFELIVVNSTILIKMFPAVTKAHASWVRVRDFYKKLDGK